MTQMLATLREAPASERSRLSIRIGFHYHVRCTAAFPSKPDIAIGISDVALGPIAVVMAGERFLVNPTYICLILELIHRAPIEVPVRVRRIMRFRSITTLVVFQRAA